ncbi:MAG: hypothetical protein DRN12_01675 [Thermoplasmata archaeon]|nr:MAG: hypothetical protein DRN12_01675 [Thermoplasmata archaeon]
MDDFDIYMDKFNEKARKYIPPKEKWTPVEEALYKPKDLYRVPLDEAKKLQLDAIKYSFKYHYENNQFYHNFCKEHGITPDDIKTNEDLKKIPLIPDKFFKEYPSGRDFATWLGNIYTGKLPKIVIKQKNPSYDDVIDAFNEAGIIVTYSSGTGGRHTFIPRDKRTFSTTEYTAAKSLLTMMYPLWEYDAHAYLMMPDPRVNFIYAGKALDIAYDLVKNVNAAITQRVTTKLISMAMGGGGGLKGKIVRYAFYRESKKTIDRIVDWLKQREKAGDKIFLIGAPYLIHFVIEQLKKEGTRLDFGENGGVGTGGGWKIHEHQRLPVSEFRKEVEEYLGIPSKYCLDIYAMVEGNGWMVHCPEGHYLHVPYTYYKAMVLNENFEPVDYGETGRFAFLDAAAFSYPGFIITGDQVKLLERCPVCDRPGPVLEPEIKRAKGEDVRGCAEEVRRMLTTDLGR